MAALSLRSRFTPKRPERNLPEDASGSLRAAGGRGRVRGAGDSTPSEERSAEERWERSGCSSVEFEIECELFKFELFEFDAAAGGGESSASESSKVSESSTADKLLDDEDNDRLRDCISLVLVLTASDTDTSAPVLHFGLRAAVPDASPPAPLAAAAAAGVVVAVADSLRMRFCSICSASFCRCECTSRARSALCQ